MTNKSKNSAEKEKIEAVINRWTEITKERQTEGDAAIAQATQIINRPRQNPKSALKPEPPDSFPEPLPFDSANHKNRNLSPEALFNSILMISATVILTNIDQISYQLLLTSLEKTSLEIATGVLILATIARILSSNNPRS